MNLLVCVCNSMWGWCTMQSRQNIMETKLPTKQAHAYTDRRRMCSCLYVLAMYVHTYVYMYLCTYLCRLYLGPPSWEWQRDLTAASASMNEQRQSSSSAATCRGHNSISTNTTINNSNKTTACGHFIGQHANCSCCRDTFWDSLCIFGHNRLKLKTYN